MSSTKTTPRSLEPLDDELVVDDLVVAVHGRLEGPHHPRQRLDRHLDAGAEAAGLRRAAPGRRPRAPGYGDGPDREAVPVSWRDVRRLESLLSRPDRRPRAPGSLVGDEVARASTARRSATSSAYQLLADERRRRARGPPRRARAHASTVDKADGRAARRRGRTARCSTRCARATTTASSASSTSCRKGMRQSLYLKDDDYRLSFLYGNFTTLTRFTEADLERVVTERLVPLYVSIHATDPEVRAELLRNRRGATSLRWLRALLDARHRGARPGRRVPGHQRRRGARRHARRRARPVPRAGDASCVVPLGVSRLLDRAAHAAAHARPRPARSSTPSSDWQDVFLAALGRRLVFAADEYYLLAGRPFPRADAYEGFPQHEDGIGMARTFEAEVDAALAGDDGRPASPRAGFFAWVDGAPAEGYRAAADRVAHRRDAGARRAPRRDAPDRDPHRRVRRARCSSRSLRRRSAATTCALVPVANQFFGGNIGVTGLLVGRRPRPRARRPSPTGHRYLLPDVVPLARPLPRRHARPPTCPRPVEIVADRRRVAASRRCDRDGRDDRWPLPVVADRRPAERRQVDAREPHRRPARGDRRGEARRHPRPQGGRGRVAGPRVPARRHRRLAAAAATTARRARSAAQAERAIARRRRRAARRRRHRRHHRGGRAGRRRCCAAHRPPVLVVANKVDDDRREADDLGVHVARPRRPVAGRARSTAAAPATCSTRWSTRCPTPTPTRTSADAPTADERRRLLGRDRRAGPTSASRRCSTGSIGDERVGRARHAGHDPRRDRHRRRDRRRPDALRRHRGHAPQEPRSTRAPSTTRSCGRCRRSTAPTSRCS